MESSERMAEDRRILLFFVKELQAEPYYSDTELIGVIHRVIEHYRMLLKFPE